MYLLLDPLHERSVAGVDPAPLALLALFGIASCDGGTTPQQRDTGDDTDNPEIDWSEDNVVDGEPTADTIFAGDGADTINGNAGDDEIYGQLGPDEINGGPGDDDLFGGIGSDNIVGDDGNDVG